MNKKIVPTHKYKTTILFLDDDVELLKFIKDNLISDKYDFLFFTNYHEFNDYLNNNEEIRKSIPSIMQKVENELSDLKQHDIVDFDFSQFNKIRSNKDKYKEVSVVFIDNQLNLDINGIQICANLNGLDIKKILLTGECDSHSTINAYGDKIISFFISKIDLGIQVQMEDNDILNKISKALERFSNDFFIEKNYYNNQLLSSKSFKELFEKIQTEYDVVEFYLIEKDMFLLIDKSYNEFFLKCWNDKDFSEYFETYYDQFNEDMNKENNYYIKVVKNEKKIPINGKLQDSSIYEELYYCITK